MVSTLEKVGYATLWTIIVAAAGAVGTGAYMSERHTEDVAEAAHLRGRVESLEKQLSEAQQVADDLRKDMDRRLREAASIAGTCPKRSDNSDIQNELIHLESENDALQIGLIKAAPMSGSAPDDYYTRLSAEFKQNLSDISELRRKLVCLP